MICQRNGVLGEKFNCWRKICSECSQERQCSGWKRIHNFRAKIFFFSIPKKRRPTRAGLGCCAYLELGPVLEVVVPGQAGVELHPVARDPGDLAGPELGVTQQGRPLIDIMPSALQSSTTWK